MKYKGVPCSSAEDAKQSAAAVANSNIQVSHFKTSYPGSSPCRKGGEEPGYKATTSTQILFKRLCATNLRTLKNKHAVNWFVGTEEVVWLYVGLYSRASIECQFDQSQYFCRTLMHG